MKTKGTTDSVVLAEFNNTLLNIISTREEVITIFREAAESVEGGAYPSGIKPCEFGKAAAWVLTIYPYADAREKFLAGFNERVAVKRSHEEMSSEARETNEILVEFNKTIINLMSAREEAAETFREIILWVWAGIYPVHIELHEFGKAVDWTFKNCPDPGYRKEFLKGFNKRING